MKVDCLIVGGSLGGVAAALSCAKTGIKTLLVTQDEWLGGQATAQGVPLDEQPWTEWYGRTRSYAEFRRKVRAYYKRNYPVTSHCMRDECFTPGAGWVNRFSFEPRVGLDVLREMLAPYRANGKLQLLTSLRPTAADVQNNTVRQIAFEGNGHSISVETRFVLDATDLGDLLPLTGTKCRYGAESRKETGESLAPEEANPMRQQAFTQVAALDYCPGEEHVINRPIDYERHRERFLSFRGYPENIGDLPEKRRTTLFMSKRAKGFLPCLWNNRRVLCAANFDGFSSDITMMIQGNGCSLPLLGVDDAIREENLAEGKNLTLSMIYYFQTELQHGDGSGRSGFPGLRLRTDVFNTEDGLAAQPYIRDSRRIEAQFTVTESDFNCTKHLEEPVRYADSVGLGGFYIDVFAPSQGGGTINAHKGHWLQQIPMGAFIPVQTKNLLPACKNIGTTHIMNGAFRVHPVEWNIGEAAGALAGFCTLRNCLPLDAWQTPCLREDYLALLETLGVQREWPGMTYGTNCYELDKYIKDWKYGQSGIWKEWEYEKD